MIKATINDNLSCTRMKFLFVEREEDGGKLFADQLRQYPVVIYHKLSPSFDLAAASD